MNWKSQTFIENIYFYVKISIVKKNKAKQRKYLCSVQSLYYFNEDFKISMRKMNGKNISVTKSAEKECGH